MQYDPNDDRFEFNNGLRVNGDTFPQQMAVLTLGLLSLMSLLKGGTNGVILRVLQQILLVM